MHLVGAASWLKVASLESYHDSTRSERGNPAASGQAGWFSGTEPFGKASSGSKLNHQDMDRRLNRPCFHLPGNPFWVPIF